MFPQQFAEEDFVGFGQFTDCADPDTVKACRRRSADEYQLLHGLWPEKRPVILPINHRHRIRLPMIAPHLRKSLIPRHPDRHRQPQLPPDPLPDLLRQRSTVLLQVGHIDPSLIRAKRLDSLTIRQINLLRLLRIIVIKIVMRRQHHQPWRLAPRLMKRFGRLDPEALRNIILGQNNAAALRLIPAHNHRLIRQIRPRKQLHRGIKAIHIDM